ncbi:Ergothioneine biosynthesis protein 1 [Cladobotryum mycophilum]|uniref:Ergothioneine biosynthesis protein 1 n=1 Tax=Cladobotryum mycophilum TaxID=491253 RepID=A0ABR0SHT2_9HYPO
MPAVKESVLLARLREQTLAANGGKPGSKPKTASIVDIRSDRAEINLKDEVAAMMNPDEGPRMLPTLLLYDEKGLQLFEDITYLDEYYLTNYEIELLKSSSAEMAEKIPDGSMVVELGSGNLRKVCLLLQAFEDLGKKIDYFALDLSQTELERTLAAVPEFKYVSCHGLRGTYDDGREWLKQPSIVGRPKCILHLGSSIGNFHRDEAAEFLGSYAGVLQPTDLMILGVDSHAYNDKEDITHQFILNGLVHANQAFGEEVFHLDDWKVIGEYIYDEDGGRHQAFVSPIRETVVLGSIIPSHERVKIEQSLKYSRTGVDKLWKMAGLDEIAYWNKNGEYGLHMMKKAKLPISGLPSLYASDTLPTIQDWDHLWEAWGIVTQKMLPKQELNEKPIKLRNACIFYLGHIPGFLDIQLTKTTGDCPTVPAYYHSIFERGIDPDVDNPEKCHDHSEIPDEWPSVEDIVAYQDRVRERLIALYANDQQMDKADVRRAIWLGFEHEILHLETLLYMLLQSDKTLPPPNTVRPDFEKLAQRAHDARVPNEWFDVPEQVITIGLDDPEDENHRSRHLGWDNEKPARKEKVHAFQAKGRPITNEEYAEYLYSTNTDRLPASWSNLTDEHANGISMTPNGLNDNHEVKKCSLPESFIQDKAVRTVYGLVPLKYALDWPVFASYDELAGCASWMGGRIPTAEETKSIYAYVEKQKEASCQSKLSNKVPAVNGHLVNDGVEETPPSRPSAQADASGSPLFIDLTASNVGFKHWHPTPVTSHGGSLAGQSAMGGVWEWTSTVLRPHEGFKPMRLYPGYTADFFDEKHNIVLGGSWATHPRVAGRKSFVNWYQRNYPYAWVGARLVRDV